MYRGTSNTRLNPIDSTHPNHGHPHSYSSQGHGGRSSSSHRYPTNSNSSPASKNDSSKNSRNDNNNPAVADENIMHMKKSAEIAAIFSGAKINQTTDILDPIHQHSRGKESYNGGDRNGVRQSYRGSQQQRTSRDENSDINQNRLSNKMSPSNNQGHNRLHSLAPQEMFSEADMHSSLGYFP